MELAGKTAVVTGASSGVGRATALELARRGVSVVVNYRKSKDEAEQTAHAIEQIGSRAIVVQGDVADDAACHATINAAIDHFGRLDVLVNNAGATSFIAHDDLDSVTNDVWDQIFRVNVQGPFQCIRAAREPMMRHGGGLVINVASVAGIAATGSSVPYAASKAALLNMTVSLARALAPSIRVNAVAPGFIAGRWLEQGLGRAYERVKERFERAAPLGKVCMPEDIAAAIMSLVTGSDLVTGQALVCDGGMLIADSAARREFAKPS